MEVIFIKDIVVHIDDNKIIFSVKNDELVKIISFNEDDKNSIIGNDEIVFSEEYILNNPKILSNFINGIVQDKNINIVYINDYSIITLILNILNYCKNISSIYIDINEELSNEICDKLLLCKYIKNIDCYSTPLYFLDEFDKKNIKVDFRMIYLSNSDFILNNNLSTYSKMYYQDNIIFDKMLRKIDTIDFSMFLKLNNHLKTINVYNFSFELLNQIVSILEENNKRDIQINLMAEIDNAQTIQNSMQYLKTLDKVYEKKLNLDFKIKYSNDYRKKNTLKQISMNIVVGCCFILNFLMLFGFVYSEYNNYMTKKSVDSLKKATVQVNNISNNDITSKEENKSENIDINDLPEQEKTNDNSTSNLKENYQNLLKINSDTVGWLTVNNTNINYPVVQSKDNDYYLSHGFYKNKTVNGWVFMDYRNNPENLGRNTIIYGHNLKNGMMFGSLRNVTSSNWYNNANNLTITFNTIYSSMKWKVFSIYIIDVTNDYIYTYFEDDNDFSNFINKIKGRSFRNFNVDVTPNDKILTLSTCQSNGTKRLVVHAKLIK